MKSIDGGVTWAQVGGYFGFCSGQCFYDIVVTVDPTNANNVYTGGSSGSNIFNRSTNGGTTFTSSATRLHADVHAIVGGPVLHRQLFILVQMAVFLNQRMQVLH